MNTYGLFSINIDTFNLKRHTNYFYPKETRDAVVTVLKAHNLTLNILGYIRQTAFYSGCARIISGIAICAATLAVGERHTDQGIIIRHWYDEALLTGITQIARGIIEAFVPYGRAVNGCLDVVATFFNLSKEASTASACQHCMQYRNHQPHDDPNYSFPFNLLDFV